MTPRPITLRPDTDFKSALRLMVQHSIHHLPVLDADRRLVGIVAERDLMFAALRYLGSDVDVEQVMHRNVVTATPDMPVADAASMMVSHAIGGLPVVDIAGNVVGVITETDIFRAFVRMHEAASGAQKRDAAAKRGVAKGRSAPTSVVATRPAASGKPAVAKKSRTRAPAAGGAPAAKSLARSRSR